MNVSVILLAGGIGSRMGSSIPKPFLLLQGQPIVFYSLEVLFELPQVIEVIVVCPPAHYPLFDSFPVRFALPGPQRQDSVYNGLQQISQQAEWVAIHDAARPFITAQVVSQLFQEGGLVGAAALGIPVTSTLKEVQRNSQVFCSLDRSKIWEIQTPQLIRKDILKAGFAYAHAHSSQVTDDVSLAELIGHPVHVVKGTSHNIKITTPEDWVFAEWLVKNFRCASPMMEQTTVVGKSNLIAFPSKGSLSMP
jgi:2-C-methyl-D-erythritol 4-phosphate cytidylyltransferase